MPVVMIISPVYLEAYKINMASYVLTDLSGHCERELLFILFVVKAESEGPHIEEAESLDASWI